MKEADKKKIRSHTTIDSIADEHIQKMYALDPTYAASVGVTENPGQYADYSPEGLAAHAEVIEGTLNQLSHAEPMDLTDKITVESMKERLGLEQKFHEAFLDASSVNNISSPTQGIRAAFDQMPHDSADQWETISEKLNNLPEAVEGYIQSLLSARNQGVVSAQRQLTVAAAQASQYTHTGDFFDRLAQQAQSSAVQIPESLQKNIQRGVSRAKSSYQDLADFLTHDLVPSAPRKDAVGKERYSLASQKFLGKRIDLEESYQWGLEELARVRNEQEKTARLIKPGASVSEAIEVLDQDPHTKLYGTDELRQWMQNLADEAMMSLGKTHFDIPEEIRTIEAMIAPTQDGVMYYTGPSDDFSRPGRMWWSVPPNDTEFNTWREATTVYHESVPGHHLQEGLTTYNKENLNQWRRHGIWVSGHGEGWALYAESLMDELGYMDNPAYRLGMWDAQRMRAARVVFDIGVHCELPAPQEYGGGIWTPEKGYDFLRANMAISIGQLDFEFIRYLGWPGQAPSYKLGQKVWEDLRADAHKKQGNDFDLKKWHMNALKHGSMGLDILEKVAKGTL